MLLWTILIDGNLYYCSDKVPLLDFIPPFVHTGHFGSTGDYYIADEKVVWTLWLLSVGTIFTIPYIVIKSLRRYTHRSYAVGSKIRVG